MDKKIIYFGSAFLNYKSLNEYNIDVNIIKRYKRLLDTNTLFGSSLPFSSVDTPEWFKNPFNVSIPNWKSYNKITFEDATDTRALELIDVYSKKDIPIVVYWSGGIDSTLIVAAILKNFPKYLKERVIICFDNTSYMENPFFYHKIIKKNFKTSILGEHNYLDSFILHGDPADSLWIQGNIIQLSTKSDVINDSVNNDPKNFIEYYKSKGFNNEETNWYLNFYKKTAMMVDIDIKTTSDFLWWSNFSQHVNSATMKYIIKIPKKRLLSERNFVDLYKENAQPWYLNNLYQVWSIQSQLKGNKFTGDMKSYKMEAKEYIFQVDKNEYYKNFKTKKQSLTQINSTTYSNSTIVFDDGSLITSNFQ